SDHQHHHQNRLDKRNNDVAEDLAGGGAIHQTGLETVGGEGLEPGGTDHRHPRRQMPDVYQHHSNHGGGGIAQPVDAGDAQKAQQVVDHTGGGVQHHPPE